MIKIKRPTTMEFEAMLDDGEPKPIRNAFEVYLTPADILSFVTDKHIVFLSEEEISKCFNIFTIAQGESWSTKMEETVWMDQHGEAFASRVRKEMEVKNNPCWFYLLLETGFDKYIAEFKRQVSNSAIPITKKYWCDPEEVKSGYIEEINVGLKSEDKCLIKLEDSNELMEVFKSEIIDVLISTENITLEWLIGNPEFDKDYYLDNIGGLNLRYKNFLMEVQGDQSTFINSKLIEKNNPHLLIEFKEKLDFGSNAWIEIIDMDYKHLRYDVCESFREAKETIDNLVKEN